LHHILLSPLNFIDHSIPITHNLSTYAQGSGSTKRVMTCRDEFKLLLLHRVYMDTLLYTSRIRTTKVFSRRVRDDGCKAFVLLTIGVCEALIESSLKLHICVPLRFVACIYTYIYIRYNILIYNTYVCVYIT